MMLKEFFPALASELKDGLVEIGEHALSESIDGLEIHGRCRCGQRNCGTFYTRPRAEWLGSELRQVIPAVHRLMAIDVWDNCIVCIEFLDRADVVACLDQWERTGEGSHTQQAVATDRPKPRSG